MLQGPTIASPVAAAVGAPIRAAAGFAGGFDKVKQPGLGMGTIQSVPTVACAAADEFHSALHAGRISCHLFSSTALTEQERFWDQERLCSKLWDQDWLVDQNAM
jgi:hypothetical protein